MWFGGADRQRTVQQVTAPTGAAVSRQDVVFNGPETWIELTANGATRVIHTTGTTWNRPADKPSTDLNLSELLLTYGDRSCMSARLEQTAASVAGQATYVIEATPSLPGCGPASAVVEASPGPAGSQPGIRLNGQPQGSQVLNPADVTIWVDKRSFLPLKTEVRDAHGTLLDRSEVTSVEYNVPIADATFVYTPRAGVPVATFNGGDGADVKRLLADGSSSGTQPRKSP